jgi:hypothetical protein
MTREEMIAIADNAVRIFESVIGRKANEVEANIIRDGMFLHALEIGAPQEVN